MATQSGEKVFSRLIEDEMRESFIDYSMSVIVQRALPDVRDGLKPVHRRILYAMHELGLQPARPHKKSATVVGDVLGKYHPHGDMAVYDALVRMVQDFSMRYPLIDGQGNFGSIDGDNAAAYRYTEARLTPLALEMLADIDKNTVGLVPNFDGRLQEPTVLPARLPNLLINGSSGIAVGMATNVPPHNLREIVAAAVAVIEDAKIPDDELERIVTAPDFPTGAYICGTDGIREAFRTGRGRLVLRARARVEDEDSSRPRIVVTEIPYMVNKARLIEQVAELVRDKRITDISDVRDESDRDGLRVVIELKRDAIPRIVLNQLYKHTQMQSTFGVIMLALVGGVPRILSLRQMLVHFVEHRHEVVLRRSQFELDQALEREHILEGLKIALDNIDAVIELIRKARDAATASKGLQERFGLSERQAEAILNMRLARLTALEVENLDAELAELRKEIKRLREILASRARRLEIVKEELEEVARKYGDPRRTEVIPEIAGLDVEDLIADEEMAITVSHSGYVKRLPLDTYRRQRRGGRGLQGMETKEEDWVEHVFVASTHDYLLVFTRRRKCHWLKVHEIPQGGRVSRGKPIINLLNIDAGDEIAALVPVREFRDDRYLLFCTRQGQVKKTALTAYGNVRSVGIIAMRVAADDELIDVQITTGNDEVILATRNGMAIRFREGDAREMGRTAAGVRGITLRRNDAVVGMVVVRPGASLLVVTENGMGKRTEIAEYRLQKRGGKGIINVKTNGKTGKVVAIKAVAPDEELMLITRNGVVNRQAVKGIRVIGRATQGVRLISLDEGDAVVDVARIIPEEDGEQDAEPGTPEYEESGQEA